MTLGIHCDDAYPVSSPVPTLPQNNSRKTLPQVQGILLALYVSQRSLCGYTKAMPGGYLSTKWNLP